MMMMKLNFPEMDSERQTAKHDWILFHEIQSIAFVNHWRFLLSRHNRCLHLRWDDCDDSRFCWFIQAWEQRRHAKVATLYVKSTFFLIVVVLSRHTLFPDRKRNFCESEGGEKTTMKKSKKDITTICDADFWFVILRKFSEEKFFQEHKSFFFCRKFPFCMHSQSPCCFSRQDLSLVPHEGKMRHKNREHRKEKTFHRNHFPSNEKRWRRGKRRDGVVPEKDDGTLIAR